MQALCNNNPPSRRGKDFASRLDVFLADYCGLENTRRIKPAGSQGCFPPPGSVLVLEVERRQ